MAPKSSSAGSSPSPAPNERLAVDPAVVGQVGDRVAAVGAGPDVVGVDPGVAGVVGVAADPGAAHEHEVVDVETVVVRRVPGRGRAVGVADRGEVRGVAVAGGPQPVDQVGEPGAARPRPRPRWPRRRRPSPRRSTGGCRGRRSRSRTGWRWSRPGRGTGWTRRRWRRGRPGRAPTLPSVPKPGRQHGDVVGGVEVAGRDRDGPVAVEGGRVVEVDLGLDRQAGHRVDAALDLLARVLRGLGVGEPAGARRR